MKTGIPTNGSPVKNHISLKNGIRIQCNTENFVPIVVLGKLTSSSSSLLSSTSMSPPRQEIDHPTSSSSSSTSPTMTSSSVSSESVAKQERRDPCGIDPYPAAVSSKHVERQERWDPCSSEISEERQLTKATNNPKTPKNVDHDQERGAVPFWHTGMAARIQGKFGGWWNSITGRLSRQFFSWSLFRADHKETWTMFILTSRKTEIARSARGPKSQGLRAEDALAESYLVQKILLTSLQQITKSSMRDVNLETIIDMQSWCRI